MSVRPVKAVSIIGMMSELEKVIRYCGESGIFHPDDAMSFYSNTEHFVPLADKNPYAAPLQELRTAAEESGVQLKYSEPEGQEEGSEEVLQYISSVTAKLEKMALDRSRCDRKTEELESNIDLVSHFTGQNLNFKELSECRFIIPAFGRIPNESYEKLTRYSEDPYVVFLPVSEDSSYHWGAYFAPIEKKADVDRIFSSLYFEKMDVPEMTGTPEEYVADLTAQLEELKKEKAHLEENARAFTETEKDKCDRYYSRLVELDSYHAIKRYVYKYHSSFILAGWIPADKAESFTKKLDGMKSIEYSLSDGKDEIKHSPPILLKNPPLFRFFEFYVKMYGVPSYNEIDPTIIVAITYTIFFGIMFGDMGQGLVVAIVGFLMWKLKKMEIGKILVPCGLCGMVFGFLYGSVFGFEELLTPVHQKLFGTKGKLFEVMEPQSINLIIYGSVAIGIVTIAVIMLVNIIGSFRRRDLESALFGANGVAGFVFYVSLVAGLICTMFLGVELMNPVYIALLIVLPLILMFLREPLGRLCEGKKDWQPESWGEYCMQSFFELFEMCLSYVTNTMSFLRVGAYILVHAGMMLVVFTLAEMVGGAGYPIIVIIGNGLVMALEALLVAIQVLRLDYYEIFSRFYVGEGRPFTPVVARAAANDK